MSTGFHKPSGNKQIKNARFTIVVGLLYIRFEWVTDKLVLAFGLNFSRVLCCQYLINKGGVDLSRFLYLWKQWNSIAEPDAILWLQVSLTTVLFCVNVESRNTTEVLVKMSITRSKCQDK